VTGTDEMGAVLTPDGVRFRVWAPHAVGVTVAGDWNAWSPDTDALIPEDGGRFAGLVPGARTGDRYKLVIDTGTRLLWRNDPYAKAVTHSAGESIVCDPAFDWDDDRYQTPPWHELVIYELHVGTFNDAPGGGPGSFASVERRLGHLRGLGVNAIELMPSAEFGKDFSWGYNPAQIFAIEEAYGGPVALKRLIRAAHAAGIAVILDVVYNHFGPADLDLWRFDGWDENGKGGIYFYNDERSRTPWGDTRPDYGRPEVRRYLADNARMWLEEFRCDGLRWDATSYIRNVDGNDGDPAGDIPEGWRLFQEITTDTDRRQPWKLHIAEDLRSNPHLTRPVGDGGAGFDTQWDAGFVHPVRAALIAGADEQRSMETLRLAVSHHTYGDALRRVIYTESHDEVANGHSRVPEEIAPGHAANLWAQKRSTLGAVLVLTSPGIPMLFQGQEILEDQWFRDEDPIDWSKEHTHAGILLMYRDLIHLRRNVAGITRGLCSHNVNVHHVNDTDKVIAFHRWERGGPWDDVIVVVNLANRSYDGYRIGLPRPGAWQVRFNSDWRGYSPLFDDHPSYATNADPLPADGMGWSGALGLGRYAAVILSQDQ